MPNKYNYVCILEECHGVMGIPCMQTKMALEIRFTALLLRGIFFSCVVLFFFFIFNIWQNERVQMWIREAHSQGLLLTL